MYTKKNENMKSLKKNNIATHTNLLHPEWIAGLCAGEMSFIVVITESSKNLNRKPRVRVSISLPLHSKERSLLKQIQVFFGCGVLVSDSNFRNVCYFRVNSFKEIMLYIIPFFQKHSLRTTRELEFNDLASVVSIMIQNKHLTSDGLSKIRSIKSGMNTQRIEWNSIDKQTMISAAWIAGFTDAEGCFYIAVTPCVTSKLKFRVVISFSISQNLNDNNVLKEIQSYFGCGHLTVPRYMNSRKLMQEFRIIGIQNCARTVLPFFDVNPLLTHKKYDYEAFREVVQLCLRKEHLTSDGLDRIRKIKNRRSTIL